jgi:hypothetical protein
MMTARYTWTADELIIAQGMHSRHSLSRPFRYTVIGFLVLIFLAGTIALFHEGPLSPAAGMVIVPLYFAFLRGYYQKWIVKRQFGQRPDKDARLDWSFTSSGILLVSSNGAKSEVPWSSFSKAVIGSNGTLLYPNAQIFQWLPHHAFDSDATYQEFVNLVRSNVSKVFDAA